MRTRASIARRAQRGALCPIWWLEIDGPKHTHKTKYSSNSNIHNLCKFYAYASAMGHSRSRWPKNFLTIFSRTSHDQTKGKSSSSGLNIIILYKQMPRFPFDCHAGGEVYCGVDRCGQVGRGELGQLGVVSPLADRNWHATATPRDGKERDSICLCARFFGAPISPSVH